MKLRPFLAAFALACCFATIAPAQNPAPSQPQTTPRKPFQPADKQAPGAAPNKVWVNSSSKVYHCPGDRYYGRTKNGRYMTEADAKAAGAHGPRGETCFQ